MKFSIVFFLGLLSMGLNAQQIQFLDLPSFFSREFEISGLTGNEENLFLAAERCGKIFVVKKEDMTHVETIHLNLEEIKGGLEIEGLSIYKDFLLITDEKGGRIFSLELKTKEFKELLPIGKDVRSFRGKYGMEGLAVDEDSNTLYLLREKNIENQSEIHSFHLSEKDGALGLNYRNQTIIQHENENWRYTGLSVDNKNKGLLCLKSYYVNTESTLNKREIDFILFDALKNSQSQPNRLLSLTKEIYFMKDSFATNVEGIFSDDQSIFITSDNGEGDKDCSQTASKTVMIRVGMD